MSEILTATSNARPPVVIAAHRNSFRQLPNFCITFLILLLHIGWTSHAYAQPVQGAEETFLAQAVEKETEPAAETEEEGEGEEAATGEEAGDDDETMMERVTEAIERRHLGISTGVIATADWLDSFFTDERIEAEAQKTRLTLGFSAFAEEESGVEFDAKARFRLTLPTFNERLQLIFSGDPDEELGASTVPRDEFNRRLRETTDQEIFAGLRYLIRTTIDQHVSIRGSVRVRGGTPVLLLEPRYRQNVPLGPWNFRFTQRFLGFSDGDIELRTIFDLERHLPQLSENFFFRTRAEGRWFDDRPGYYYNLSAALFQRLGSSRVLEYQWNNQFQTQPGHRLENVRLRVRYRQSVHWEWLYVELAPQVSFPRERSFNATPGFLLEVGVIFGAY